MIGIGVRPVKIGYALEKKLKLLKAFYDFYENLTEEMDFACKPGCHLCCTPNVTLTSLEGFYILRSIKKNQYDLLSRLKKSSQIERFRPIFTPNALALMCLRGEEIPEEPSYGSGFCPLLENNLCLIYSVRPFACRSFLSKIRCDLSREAVVDPWFFDLNTVFMQILEWLDIGGVYGNLIDLLPFLAMWEKDPDSIKTIPAFLLSNHPLPEFAIPEESNKIRPFLGSLYRLRVEEKPFKKWLDEIESSFNQEEPLSFLKMM